MNFPHPGGRVNVCSFQLPRPLHGDILNNERGRHEILGYNILVGGKKELGDDEITEKVEMVGWGVEEAEVRSREDASEFTPSPTTFFRSQYPTQRDGRCCGVRGGVKTRSNADFLN